MRRIEEGISGKMRIRRFLRRLFVALAVLIVLPVGLNAATLYARGWAPNWNAADWSSAGIAPDPRREREAMVLVYAARTGRWKSIFAVHTWIVVKAENAARFTRYEVVGWGRPVRRDAYPVDGRWYGNGPLLIHEVRGAAAAALIPRIEGAVARYPWTQAGSYRIWPGPNSNTFIAWIARELPEFGLEMPPIAVGKDYLGAGLRVARTPSGTGWQVSLGGLLGAAVGIEEGVELHLLGGTLGIDPLDLAIEVPGIGVLSPRSRAGAM
jgi:hypothetical protein